MTTLYILSIIGVIVSWLGAFILDNNRVNLFIHAILAVVAWPISLTVSIISIILGGIALILNITMISKQ